MCSHNLQTSSSALESIFSSTICTFPTSKSMQIYCSLNPFSVVHSKICNGYVDSGRQATSGMWVGLKEEREKKGGHISPADKLCSHQITVSRPKESNLKGISGRMSAEQVDHDVMWWISRDTEYGCYRSCHFSDSTLRWSRDAWQTRDTRMSANACIYENLHYRCSNILYKCLQTVQHHWSHHCHAHPSVQSCWYSLTRPKAFGASCSFNKTLAFFYLFILFFCIWHFSSLLSHDTCLVATLAFLKQRLCSCPALHFLINESWMGFSGAKPQGELSQTKAFLTGGAEAVYNMRKVMVLLNIKACKPSLLACKRQIWTREWTYAFFQWQILGLMPAYL